MGAIKDIVDLVKDLESRAKDRRDMETVHKIQALAFSLQSQYVEIVERDVSLVRENAELKRQLSEAQSEEVRIHRFIEFRRSKRTDGKWVAFCPKCHMPVYNEEGMTDVICSDRACKWHVRLDNIPLSQATGELGA